MDLTERYDRALVFASDLHRRQFRKGAGIPYLTHLLSVSALVMEHGGDEDQAIAGLLHDALEDQGDSYAGGRAALAEEIAHRFGRPVLEIVESCTDDLQIARQGASREERVRNWQMRKQAYLAHLARAGVPALRVSCADKVHNARTLLLDHRRFGEALWARFHADTRELQMWYYGGLVDAFEARVHGLGDDGLLTLVGELAATVQTLRSGRHPYAEDSE